MNISPDVYQKIIAAKLYIDGNFHECINLEGISGKAFISRFHFHRLFTRIYHKTPHQYLTEKRINLARELLSGDDLTVTEICWLVGFESMGSFSVLFKREMGCPPRSFRNIALQKRKQIQVSPRSFIPNCFIY